MATTARIFMATAPLSAQIEIRDERAADLAAREALLDACFGPGRLRKTCERLRAGRLPAEGLSLAAVEGESLVGSLRFWNVVAGDRPALLLGPLCVAADRRSLGLGARMVAEGMVRAADRGHRAVLLIGNASYYRRFDFVRRLTLDLRMPGPVELERFLGLELVPGALEGASGLVRASGACATRPEAVWRAA